MHRFNTATILALLGTLALAGCVQTADVEPQLTTIGIPASVDREDSFTFQLQAQGGDGLRTTHIGAHYWSEAQSNPTAALSTARACDHIEDETILPGTYSVTCTLDNPGTWYVYGHIRVMDDETPNDYWAKGAKVVVGALGPKSFALETEGIPEAVNVGQEFTFQLQAEGTNRGTSTHVGAHYWMEQPENPTAGLSDARACEHAEGYYDIPGTYDITCRIDEVGTWHMYGHIRATEGNIDYWAAPVEITVRPM